MHHQNSRSLQHSLSYALFFTVLLFGASPALANTVIGADISTDGSLTVTGSVNMNDPSADTLLLGAAADTVTIAGDVSVADAQWGV